MSDQIVAASITPSVAVVVPSYNHSQFIAACLRSIFKQTARPSQLLVIDDGSSDGSPQVIDSILSECPFPCEFIARENRGLSATLNQGLAATRGDYFAYLSSDDIWLGGYLESRIKLLFRRPAAVLAYGNAYLIDKQNKVVDCTADWAHYRDGDVRDMLLKAIAPMSPTVLYRRDAIVRHGWNEAARLEDYELYLKLSCEGEFAFDPKPLAAWRMHSTNTSWNQLMMLEEHVAALRAVGATLNISNSDLETKIKAIKFARAEDFLRLGDKKKGAQLALANLSGASLSGMLRVLSRLAIPYSVMNKRRQHKHLETSERYGSLEI